MIIIPKHEIDRLTAAIIEATTSAMDAHGVPVILETIDYERARSAAIASLYAATGQTVWPGDRLMKVEPRRRLLFIEGAPGIG